VRAFEMIEHPEKCLVMVGDGELGFSMKQYISERKINGVFLTGFINQTEIINYYASADIFVMCSGEGETWGLSVNEAMNFDLPVVVSDMTGCADDLVDARKSGMIVMTGVVEDIAANIKSILAMNYSTGPSEQIKKYSFDSIYSSLNLVAAK
jgi:glycosyltransferase involved in cell wall biosynthesis